MALDSGVRKMYGSSARAVGIEFRKEASAHVVSDIKQLLMANLWHRNWDGETANRIFEWRYRDLDGQETVLAYDHGRPVAMVACSQRCWIVNGKIVRICEPSDWLCLSEFRQLGLGVLLMQRLMNEPEPLLAIGGAEQAQKVLRAFGWQQRFEARSYLLPLSSRFFVSRAANRLRRLIGEPAAKMRSQANGPRWRHPQLWRKPTISWHQLAPLEPLPEIPIEAAGYDIMPLVDEREMRWMRTAPKEMGSFFCLVFPSSSEAAGFAIGRLFPYEGLRYVRLIHVQIPHPSVTMYRRVVSETLRYAYSQGADVAQLRASCPLLQSALRKFWPNWSVPAATYWWEKSGTLPGAKSHLTFLRGDDGVLPYPT